MKWVLILFIIFSSTFFETTAQEPSNEEVDFTELTADDVKDARGIEKKLLIRRLNPKISKKYSRGRYLIFDCVDNHYACVYVENVNKCRKDRDIAIEKNQFKLPCAPLKVFQTQKSCFEDMVKRFENLNVKDFCQNKKSFKL